MKKFLLSLFFLASTFGSSAMAFDYTVEHVDISKYMGQWYVIAGRFTFLENGAHNAIETYTWNESKERVDIDFKYNKGSLDGPLKSYPQKAWITNSKTNAEWEISPFWPLRFSYLIIAIDPNYEWTVVGVPSERYLWIMSRYPKMSEDQLNEILSQVEKTGYNIKDITYIPHK